jgi:hypothetical protein
MVWFGGAGAVHHAILLWPLPALMIAVPLAGASRRLGDRGLKSLATVVALLVFSELAVTNEYYVQMVRNGATGSWTDAIFALYGNMKDTRAKQVFCMDWGMLDSLRLLSKGKLPLRVGYGLTPTPRCSPIHRMCSPAMSRMRKLFVAAAKNWFDTRRNRATRRRSWR